MCIVDDYLKFHLTFRYRLSSSIPNQKLANEDDNLKFVVEIQRQMYYNGKNQSSQITVEEYGAESVRKWLTCWTFGVVQICWTWNSICLLGIAGMHFQPLKRSNVPWQNRSCTHFWFILYFISYLRNFAIFMHCYSEKMYWILKKKIFINKWPICFSDVNCVF